MGNIHYIGSSIRQIRKDNDITLKQMAEATGLSIGYLSNMERNVNSPTLENLQKICEVLDTSIGDLLERKSEERIIIRKEDREIQDYDCDFLKAEIMDFGENYPLFECTDLGPSGSNSMSWEHSFDEFGYVLEGEMEIELAGETYELSPGDMVVVKAHTRHSISNYKKEPCITFWCRTRAKKPRQQKKEEGAS